MLMNFMLARLTIVALVFGLLTGCGNGSSSGAPYKGSIVINPASMAWTVTVPAATTCAGTNIEYTAFTLTVYDSNLRPVNDVDMDVVLDFTASTSTGSKTMYLYDDPAWVAGSPLPPTNLIAGSNRVKTGAFGSKRLIVGMDLGCTYKGALHVYSGTVYQKADLSVTVTVTP